ncbi:MAG TPA: histidine phosphatase family protein [Galbitalea sp.]
MRLILVRHGQTPSNVKHVIDTATPGPGLTALGRDQAEALPAALANEQIDAIFVSTLVRTQQTADPLSGARDLPVYVRAGIREIEAGEFEGKKDRTSVHDFVSTELGWVRGDLDRRMPGAQDGHETLGRFDVVVAEAEAAGHESVVFVSHGSMIRTWAGSRAGNVDVEFVYKNPLNNTGVVMLEGGHATGWTVVSWQDTAMGAGLDDAGQAGPVADNS